MRRRRNIAIVVVGLAVVAAGGWLWNEHRTIGIRDAVNPAYWVRRWRGEDLYDEKSHILFHGNRANQEIALTIDDGPNEPFCTQLLDIFREQGIRATFFVVGRRVKEHPDVVRRMLEDGHEVANHSQNHYRLDTLPADQCRREINDCDINFYRATGRHLSILRPPGVRYNDTVVKSARELGYEIISWNDAAKDFLDVSPDFIVNRTLRRTENGSIILLHDDRSATVTAMPRILSELKRQGYKFVSISEMLAHLPKPVMVESNANPPGSRVAVVAPQSQILHPGAVDQHSVQAANPTRGN